MFFLKRYIISGRLYFCDENSQILNAQIINSLDSFCIYWLRNFNNRKLLLIIVWFKMTVG